MRKTTAALLVVIVLLIGVGCADTSDDPQADQGAQLQAGSDGTKFKGIVIEYKGKNLYCVERGGTSHGRYSGLSCDWVAYHGLRAEE